MKRATFCLQCTCAERGGGFVQTGGNGVNKSDLGRHWRGTYLQATDRDPPYSPQYACYQLVELLSALRTCSRIAPFQERSQALTTRPSTQQLGFRVQSDRRKSLRCLNFGLRFATRSSGGLSWVEPRNERHSAFIPSALLRARLAASVSLPPSPPPSLFFLSSNGVAYQVRHKTTNPR